MTLIKRIIIAVIKGWINHNKKVNEYRETNNMKFMKILKLNSHTKNTNDIDDEDHNTGDKWIDKS